MSDHEHAAFGVERHALWAHVFGNPHPIEVEIGPGTGVFLLWAARTWPSRNFYGIEHSHSRAMQLQTTIASAGLTNARAIAADASCMTQWLIPTASVATYHIYFPDPWWKRRHHRRRIFTPPFVAALSRTLAPGGRICLATDVHDVYVLMTKSLLAATNLQHVPDLRPPQRPITSFERKGRARGADIFEAVFVSRPAASDLGAGATSATLHR